MTLKLKLIKSDEKSDYYKYGYIEYAAPEGGKTVVATEKGMLRKPGYCSKGVEKESCMMYRIGKCCDEKEDK
jgi:hypothetical protein